MVAPLKLKNSRVWAVAPRIVSELMGTVPGNAAEVRLKLLPVKFEVAVELANASQ